jgi:DNA-binding transcriptional ArsR family regulator
MDNDMTKYGDRTSTAAIYNIREHGGSSSGSSPPKPEPAWKQHTVSAASLHGMMFPDINYVVPDFIPEGLCILAGRPKVGKSWLALDICLGVSLGQEVLGVEPDRGDVLYCALEDTDRRLQRRMKKLLWPPKGAWPEELTFATRWNRLDAGGVTDIAEWAKSVKKPRLVVLDTLAGVRPERSKTDTTYDGDYKALVEAHRLANDGGFAILVLTHTRKMGAEDDPLDAISGTLGQVGCADTGMVLSKGPQGASLYLRGRDIEEAEKAVVFNADTCRWQILGEAAEVRKSDTRKKIRGALEDAAELMNPTEIARITGVHRNTVDQQLSKMLKDGEVVAVARGQYAHPSKAHQFKTDEEKEKRGKRRK